MLQVHKRDLILAFLDHMNCLVSRIVSSFFYIIFMYFLVSFFGARLDFGL